MVFDCGVEGCKTWREAGGRRTCEENISSIQRGVLISHFHDVQVQALQSFFHGFGLDPEKQKAERLLRSSGRDAREAEPARPRLDLLVSRLQDGK